MILPKPQLPAMWGWFVPGKDIRVPNAGFFSVRLKHSQEPHIGGPEFGDPMDENFICHTPWTYDRNVRLPMPCHSTCAIRSAWSTEAPAGKR